MKFKKMACIFVFLICAIFSGIAVTLYARYKSLSTPAWVGICVGGLLRPLYSLSEPAFALAAVLSLVNAKLPDWLRKTALVIAFLSIAIYLAVFVSWIIWENSTVFRLFRAFGTDTYYISFTVLGVFLALGCYPKNAV